VAVAKCGQATGIIKDYAHCAHNIMRENLNGNSRPYAVNIQTRKLCYRKDDCAMHAI